MILDRERLRNEEPMLTRLCVGLLSEGASLVRVVPDSMADLEAERELALAERVRYQARPPFWMRGQRRKGILEHLQSKPPEVIYTAGTEAWLLAAALATALKVPLVLDVWSRGQIRPLAARRLSALRPVIVAASEGLRGWILERDATADVRVVSPGVTIPKEPAAVLEHADRQIAIAMLGRGSHTASFRAALEATSAFLTQHPQAHLFLELEGAHDHQRWLEARQHDMLGRTSALTHAVHHRKLLAQCDVALLPGAEAEVRTVVFDLMAGGVPLIVNRDPVFDCFNQDGPVVLAHPPDDADAWAEPLNRMVTSPQALRDLGLRGRELAKSDYRSSRQAETLFGVFHDVLSGGAIPFAEAAKSQPV